MILKQSMARLFGLSLLCLIVMTGCENRPLQDNSEMKPREIHEDIEFHFDEIMVDGVEYLILEKDNNNPHEGFGFMAFRANKLLEKQDTILAYMRTVTQMQALIYAKLYNKSLEESQQLVDDLYEENLKIELDEIYRLEKTKLSSEYLGSGGLEDNSENNEEE
jgi:hypothetical protein